MLVDYRRRFNGAAAVVSTSERSIIGCSHQVLALLRLLEVPSGGQQLFDHGMNGGPDGVDTREITVSIRMSLFARMMSLAPLLILQWMLAPSTEAQEPPTKAFQQRDVPLSWIFNEWRQNGNNANIYLCACDREICDTRPGWPFRSFRTGQAIPVLGEANLGDARRVGFICGRR